MQCLHPLPAWRTEAGEITLKRTEALRSRESLKLACGGCINCRSASARHWAVRCSLEAQQHEQLCWSTLTYEEKYKPPTLRKDHLSGWLKRLRSQVAPTRIRFFASGEYGEKTHRPHYHAILFGIGVGTASKVQSAWPYGYAQTDVLTPAAIAYVAGYTSKKLKYNARFDGQKVDPDTGEVYDYQPPFLQMSRGGRNGTGIGGQSRTFWRSWRSSAIANGYEIKVPRYLHEAWKAHATQEDIEQLQYEQYLRIKEKKNATTLTEEQEQRNREINAHARQRLAAERRKL